MGGTTGSFDCVGKNESGLPSSTGARRIASQVVAVWVVQVILLVAQLVYTAGVSRQVSPSGFGQYATALAIIAVASMFANAGLSNATARRGDDNVLADRRTVTVGLIAGTVVTTATLVTVPLWARLWSDPDAAAAIRLASLSLLLGPAGAILLGVLRRQGRLGAYNAVQFGANLAAMLVGWLVVHRYQTGWALAVLPVVSNGSLFVGGAVVLRSRVLPTWKLHGVKSDVQFGLKSMGLWGIAVVGNTVPLWALGRFSGSYVLGQWNRAQVVGRLPFEVGTRGLLTVIFPRLRGGRSGDPDTARMWSTMLAASALVVFPVGSIVLPATPAAVTLLMGDQWTTAAQMVPYLCVGGMGLVLSLILAGALEASGLFRIALGGELAWLVTMLLGALATAVTSSWLGIAVAVAIAPIAGHSFQCFAGIRADLLNARMLALWYTRAVLFGGVFGAACLAFVSSVSAPQLQLLAAAATLAVAATLLLVGARWWGSLRELLALLRMDEAATDKATPLA